MQYCTACPVADRNAKTFLTSWAPCMLSIVMLCYSLCATASVQQAADWLASRQRTTMSTMCCTHFTSPLRIVEMHAASHRRQAAPIGW